MKMVHARNMVWAALAVACNTLPLASDGGALDGAADVLDVVDGSSGVDIDASADAAVDVVIDAAPVLRTFATSVSAFALDSNNVYIADATKQSIVVCPRTGCSSSPTVIASNQPSVGSIAFDSTDLFWTDSSSVFSCSKSGCGQNPTAIMTPQSNLSTRLVATDGVYVFFTSSQGLFYCSVSGCGGAPHAITSGYQMPGLAAQSGYAYWSNDLDSTLSRSTTTNVPEILEFDAGYPIGVALDSTSVWWTARDVVAKCPQNGCGTSPTVLATSAFPGPIAVDGVNAYWTNQGFPDGGHSDIFRCSKTGCGGNPTSLATEPSFKNLFAIGVDAQSVYWLADGTLMQLTPK